VSHGSLCSTQISFVGAKGAGSSSVAVVMSIVSGFASLRQLSEVPQWLQNPRNTRARIRIRRD
jgi:hypothetical protein